MSSGSRIRSDARGCRGGPGEGRGRTLRPHRAGPARRRPRGRAWRGQRRGDGQKELDLVAARPLPRRAARRARSPSWRRRRPEPVALDRAGSARRRDRSARRVVQYRPQHVGRDDLRDLRGIGARRAHPAAGLPAARGGLRHLRAADQPRLSASAAASRSSPSTGAPAPSGSPPSAVAIPSDTREYAINASNYRHWDEAVRAYHRRLLKRARAGRAARTSTCAGSRRSSPTPTGS